MPKKLIDAGQVRKAVREVLHLAAGEPTDEEMLLRFVRRLIGQGVDVQMLRDALEWNLGENFIRYQEDKESEETHWFITKQGQAKESIK